MGTLNHALVAGLVVWWNVAVNYKGQIRLTGCTDLAIAAHADAPGLSTNSGHIQRAAEDSSRECAVDADSEIDTGQRLVDSTWRRGQRSGKALQLPHRRGCDHNYILHPRRLLDSWAVHGGRPPEETKVVLGYMSAADAAEMEFEERRKSQEAPTGSTGCTGLMDSPTRPRDKRSGGEGVRKAHSVSTSPAAIVTSPGMVGLLFAGQAARGKGILSRVRRIVFTPPTESTQTQRTLETGTEEHSDQAHAQSTALFSIEREWSVLGLTEINDADSLQAKGPWIRDISKKTPTLGSATPRHASCQSQEHQETATQDKQQREGKEQRREVADDGRCPDETNGQLEGGYRPIIIRKNPRHGEWHSVSQVEWQSESLTAEKHKDRGRLECSLQEDETDQGSGLSMGFH